MSAIVILTHSTNSPHGREILQVNSHGTTEYVHGSSPSGVDPSGGKEDSWFRKDKALHLMVSSLITGLSYRVYHDEYRNPEVNSRLFGGAFTLLLGIGKETVDATRISSTSSWKDLTADGLGILFGLLLFTSTF